VFAHCNTLGKVAEMFREWSIFVLKQAERQSVKVQGGPRKSSPGQGQQHAIEDGQRWGGGETNTDSTTVD
jgi:hypothetical protein